MLSIVTADQDDVDKPTNIWAGVIENRPFSLLPSSSLLSGIQCNKAAFEQEASPNSFHKLLLSPDHSIKVNSRNMQHSNTRKASILKHKEGK